MVIGMETTPEVGVRDEMRDKEIVKSLAMDLKEIATQKLSGDDRTDNIPMLISELDKIIQDEHMVLANVNYHFLELTVKWLQRHGHHEYDRDLEDIEAMSVHYKHQATSPLENVA